MDEASRLTQAAELEDIKFYKDEPMSRHTSMQVGGPAALLARPRSIRELASLVYLAEKNNFRWMVMGAGSNLIFPDAGYQGLVVKTTPDYAGVYLDDEGVIRAEAGAPLSRVAALAAENGLTGLEFAQGIPGSVGGALYMNAGAYGGEVGALVRRTCYMDAQAKLHMLAAQDHAFGYRTSLFRKERGSVILYTEFQLKPGDKGQIQAAMADYAARRREKQPLDLPSAGSVYKRPEGRFAGELIERCGLKGYRVGGAMVSPKHAGFIVNCGGATASDVIALMEHIEETVFAQTGVELEREVRIAEHKRG